MVSAAQLKPDRLPTHPGDLPPDHIYFGPSEAMQAVRQRVDRAATLNVPILILGESGTGKEVLARFIHNRSPWSNGPFVKVNCPAIPGTLIESELFGFEKGAFTGATAAKPGRIEIAEGGTLFLDEIAELDASLQAKLLHVLQDGHFTRIGDHEEKRMDARVICATNRILKQEIESGGFRSDLFYRINVISVTLPSLRDRRDDIPYLIEYLRQMFNRRFQREAPRISKEAIHTSAAAGLARQRPRTRKLHCAIRGFGLGGGALYRATLKRNPSISPTNGRLTAIFRSSASLSR